MIELPSPTIQGYGFEIDAGLLRTPMDSGTVRQRRRWKNNWHTFQLRWVVTVPQLHTLMAAIDDHGYTTGIEQRIITEAESAPTCTPYRIRIASNPQVQALQKNVWQVTATGEIPGFDPATIDCDKAKACIVAHQPASAALDPATWTDVAAGLGDQAHWGTQNP